MSLEMRGTSKWWYGRIELNGSRTCRNLGIKIEGKRPARLSETGDRAFEQSRGRALAELERRQASCKKLRSKEEFIQQVHELHTGERINSIPIEGIFEAWQAIPRKRKPSERYIKQAGSIFVRFNEFLSKRYPSVKQMAGVQHGMAESFLDEQEQRGVSPKTYNNHLILLRSAFSQLRRKAGLVENPFDGIPTKEEDTIFRKPFSAQELADIHKASEEDEFIRPVIVTAMCTALRRGDCCLLKKTDVDVQNRFVTVKTSKTGETVQIPMFPMLHDELSCLPESSSEYVFPEQAEMYLANPDGITWRVKQVLKDAGFYDKKERDDEKDPDKQKNHKADTHRIRANGLRQASIRDFHSFRVTWVTLALTSNVPLELVQKVTGHRTVNIVLKHYFQPGRDDFRKALESKMPSLLSMNNGDSRPSSEASELLSAIRKKICSLNASNFASKKNHVIDEIDKLFALLPTSSPR